MLLRIVSLLFFAVALRAETCALIGIDDAKLLLGEETKLVSASSDRGGGGVCEFSNGKRKLLFTTMYDEAEALQQVMDALRAQEPAWQGERVGGGAQVMSLSLPKRSELVARRSTKLFWIRIDGEPAGDLNAMRYVMGQVWRQR